MSTEGDQLGDLIKTNLDGVVDKTNRTDLMRAMGNAIVSEGGLESRCRVTRATTQSIPHNTDVKVEYNIVGFDELDEYDETVNFRFIAKKTGYYDVKASVLFTSTAWPANYYCRITIARNGVHISYGSRSDAAAMTGFKQVTVAGLIHLETGQYIEIFVKHIQGGAVNLYTSTTYNYFSVHRLS